VKNPSGNSNVGEHKKRRPVSIEEDSQLYDYGPLSKQQSMMNLGMEDQDEEMPRRSSTRKKIAEVGNCFLVKCWMYKY